VTDLVLNELSLSQFRRMGQPRAAANQQQARAWMGGLVQTLIATSRIGLSRSLRTFEDFSNQELAPGYYVYNWRNDPVVNADERRLFSSFITKSPLLDGLADSIMDRARGCEATFEGVAAKGLLVAFIQEFLAVSFASDAAWLVSRLEIQLSELDADGNLERGIQAVRHASRSADVDDLAEHFRSRQRREAVSGEDLVDRREELLPHVRFCGDVAQALRGIGRNDQRLGVLRRWLYELNDCCANWLHGPFPHGSLRARPSCESRTVYDNVGLRRLRMFRCPDGQERYFEWHMKNLGLNLRLHYLPTSEGHIVSIGYIGPHLPTQQY
jgi:hypothetical protein